MSETAVIIGQCVKCKRAYRLEVPATMKHMYPRDPGLAIRAAGLTAPWCDCRTGVKCEGRGGCGETDCHGHAQTFVRFGHVKVTYKADIVCGGACWAAKGDGCACSCRGANHGGSWAMASALMNQVSKRSAR
jgi:hypothetical protein